MNGSIGDLEGGALLTVFAVIMAAAVAAKTDKVLLKLLRRPFNARSDRNKMHSKNP